MTDSTLAWTALAAASTAAWLWLLLFRGGFWRARPLVEQGQPPALRTWPAVTAVVPARNEAAHVGEAVASLLAQDYPGAFGVVVVDDRSTDGTAAVARRAADDYPDGSLRIVAGTPTPSGWAGKVWAMHQGVAAATDGPSYLLFADADIAHDRGALRTHVARAERDGHDLVSAMVRLDCRSFWDRLLIPPFVLFFQMLYPFAWVNDPARREAAAAGGTMLVRTEALHRIGGMAAIRDALIDDCALAAAIKGSGGSLWLGLATDSRSLRGYDGLGGIWTMVARSAYTQLRHSPILLAATVVTMVVVFCVPPAVVLAWPVHGNAPAGFLGVAAWALQAVAAGPVLALYGLGGRWRLALPAAAVLYAAMTVDSACRHWQGRGGQWKGRIGPRPER